MYAPVSFGVLLAWHHVVLCHASYAKGHRGGGEGRGAQEDKRAVFGSNSLFSKLLSCS